MANIAIVQLTAGILAPIVKNLRFEDMMEIQAAVGEHCDLAARCLSGPAFAVTNRHQPVAAFGYVQRSLAVVEGWSFGTNQFWRIMPELTRFIREDLRRTWRGQGIRVCEVRSIEGNDAAHRWLRAMDFEEVAQMRNQGAGGETFHLFAWQLGQ